MQKLSQKRLEKRMQVFESMKATLQDREDLIIPEIRFNERTNFGYMVIDGPIVPEAVCRLLRSNGFAINYVESKREKGTPSYATRPMFVTSMSIHFYDTIF